MRERSFHAVRPPVGDLAFVIPGFHPVHCIFIQKAVHAKPECPGTCVVLAPAARSPAVPRGAQRQRRLPLGAAGVAACWPPVPPLAGGEECEQVAQLDSKDMDAATWQRLARRVAHAAGAARGAGVVVTHGTDTLEETAWLLQRVLAPAKPVVLTAAMRPAAALGGSRRLPTRGARLTSSSHFW
jgi:hypothetical protein